MSTRISPKAASTTVAAPAAWKAVGGFAVALMLSGGALWASTIGIFLAPLEHELGWSQTQVYLGVSIT